MDLMLKNLFRKKDKLIFDNPLTNFFFSNSFEPFLITDRNLKFNEANLTLCSLLGFTKEELLEKTLKEITYDKDKELLDDLLHLSEKDIKTFKLRLLSKEGKVFWFEIKVKNENNKKYLFIGNNVTAQIGVEQKFFAKNIELEEEKAKLNAMLENIGDGIIGINNRGEIVFINPQAELMLGVGREELVGKMLIHSIKLFSDKNEEVSPQQRPIHTALFSKKKVTTNKFLYQRNDGKKFPVAITATPIISHDLVIGGVDVFRDITKEKEIDRMKTEFISLASHQLRTPLSAMKWFAELLLDDSDNLSKEQKEMINNIYQSNERMIELVNALLNISRIESGRIIIEPEPTDLVKLVKEVILELQPKILERKQRLGISVHQALPTVNIDPKLIRHVYMNLLTNALKYTHVEGEIIVIISKSGEEIISQVSDNGYGIPIPQQKQVFQKFFRADNVAKIVTDGTGLGLYLTKSIVESSGGKIWFKSDEGKGTTFWFSLPLKGTPPKKGEVSIDT